MMIFFGALFVLFVLLLPAILEAAFSKDIEAVLFIRAVQPLYYFVLRVLFVIILFVSVLNALWS